jgi:hypothetical protein
MTSAFFKGALWVMPAATGDNDTWVDGLSPTGTPVDGTTGYVRLRKARHTRLLREVDTAIPH